MFSDYLKHRYHSFKYLLFGFSIVLSWSVFLLALSPDLKKVFDGSFVGISYEFVLVIALLFFAYSFFNFVTVLFYILVGDDVKRDASGKLIYKFDNLFNFMVSKLYLKEFTESIRFLEG